MRILEGLRASTADTHLRLHHAPLLHQLTEKTLTQNYYVRALKKFYGFYKPLEACYSMTRISELHNTFPPHITIQNIEHDLIGQNIDPGELPVMSIPLKSFTIEESLAYLYLREGSNLGGKVISKNLQDTLHLAPATDNRFFWGHGEKVGSQWKLFTSYLDAFEKQTDRNAIISFASYLFESLEAWMNIEENKYA